MTQLSKLGYRCARVSASGQRKSEKCIAGDLIAIAPARSPLPHIVAEIGGTGKRLGAAFKELRADPLPSSFVALVGRVVK